ncbi:hypothetical protein ACFRFU_53700 [Streptomyces sp. NPDC056704]|uniref:hypothetical protein n=1 Tax=Streptomyces sp. NPDC056704 TaxID=3345917 RepID=UPI0036983289
MHSRYVRRLADSAVGHRRVVIELQVRRFRCGEGACPQRTFAEQVSGLTFRYGRRSAGLQVVLEKLALMLAGRAEARLVDTLAVPASRSTLLRLIRALPEPAPHTPRVLGVDEFALRKGMSMPPCWWISRPGARWICCPTGTCRRWPSGWPTIPVSR